MICLEDIGIHLNPVCCYRQMSSLGLDNNVCSVGFGALLSLGNTFSPLHFMEYPKGLNAALAATLESIF